MQRLEVSGAVRPIYGSVRPIYGSLGVKRLDYQTNKVRLDYHCSSLKMILGSKHVGAILNVLM